MDAGASIEGDEPRRQWTRPKAVFTRRGVVRPPFSPQLEKYYYRRHALFSRFNAGVWMDAEGWYSATPEVVAKRSAELLTSSALPSLFVDAFVGCGGNAIQTAMYDPYGMVIAIDIDPLKVSMARHNAEVYGVAHRIQFVVGDFTLLAPRLRAHVCFLSPPWGGPNYGSDGEEPGSEEQDRQIHHLSAGGADGGAEEREKGWHFRISSMVSPCCGIKLFDLAHSVAPTIGYYLPACTDDEDLRELARRHQSGKCESVSFVLLWTTERPGSSGNETGGGDAQKLSKKARRRARKRKPNSLLACFHESGRKLSPSADRDSSSATVAMPPSSCLSTREETLYMGALNSAMKRVASHQPDELAEQVKEQYQQD